MHDARARFTTLLIALLVFTTPGLAQDAAEVSSHGLVAPERFDVLLPAELPGGWERNNFSARSSASENWGGSTYMSEDGAFRQLELRHYTPDAWQRAQDKAEEEAAETVGIDGLTGFYDPTHRGMPTPVLSVFLDGHFAVRVVGPQGATREEMAAALGQVPLDEVAVLTGTSDAQETPSASAADLLAVLPEQAAGWARPTMTASDERVLRDRERPALEMTYEKEGLPYSLWVFLGADDAARQSVTKYVEQGRADGAGAVRKVERAERSVYLLQGSENEIGLALSEGDVSALMLVCGEALDCTVPDAEAARRELLALYDALNLDRLAAPANEGPSEPAPASTAVLRSLLPETLAGMMRGRVREAPDEPIVVVAYGREGVPYTVNVRLAAGHQMQRRMRGLIEEESSEPDADVRTTTHEGYTLYLKRHRGESTVSLIALAGETMVMLNAHAPAGESFDDDAVTDRLYRAFDELDTQRLAALEALGTGTPAVEAPAGFEAYAANWPSGHIALAYPKAWTLTDILARTGWIEALSITSSAEAAEALYDEGINISTEDTVRLVTPENAIVSVGMMGVEAEGTPPLQMIEVMDGSAVADAEVTQPPTSITLDDGTEAAMREVRGTDADGRAIVGQQWALASGGQLISVSAFLPAERAEELAPTLRTVLENIRVTPK